MRRLIVATILALIALPHQPAALRDMSASSFAAFVSRHGRDYTPGTSEYELRRSLFEERAAQVRRQNAAPGRLWTAALGPHADRTPSELARLLGWRGRPTVAATDSSAGPYAFVQTRAVALPAAVSWAHLRSMGRVHDQGNCGSCWAVASASMLEAHVEIHMGANNSRTFSVQELVNCVPNPRRCGGNGGCDGATMELAMDWAMRRGLADENVVEYRGTDGVCQAASLAERGEGGADDAFGGRPAPEGVAPGVYHRSGQASFGMVGWERLATNEEEPIRRALVERGPVGVSVDATDWFAYAAGIFDGCRKDAVVNHAVLLMGYGQTSQSPRATKFWTIQNSWSRSWGESGRIRLLRHGEGAEPCGVDRSPLEGSGCPDGPPEVTVCGACGILFDAVVPHFDGERTPPLLQAGDLRAAPVAALA